MNTQSEFVRCPCCLTEYSSVDEPDAFERVATFDPLRYAAKTLGQSSKGHTKSLTPEQRKAKARVLAVNRSKRQNKTTI